MLKNVKKILVGVVVVLPLFLGVNDQERRDLFLGYFIFLLKKYFLRLIKFSFSEIVRNSFKINL
ncbi:Uncharacterised protein [Candidatus Ornithobacterium hominis]|nr:Uncharacterised protein [Candidatus Ornithobacterium hominis]